MDNYGISNEEAIRHLVERAKEAQSGSFKGLSRAMDFYYEGKRDAYMLAARYIKGYASSARYGKAGIATRRYANA